MADIVVIDSDAEERNAIARTLIGAGHRVHRAEDGEAGIAICRRENPTLVITAMVLPEKDGIEIIRELPRDMPDVPIVAISGARQASLYLRAARLLGAAAVLRKPFQRRRTADRHRAPARRQRRPTATPRPTAARADAEIPAGRLSLTSTAPRAGPTEKAQPAFGARTRTPPGSPVAPRRPRQRGPTSTAFNPDYASQ